MMLRPADKILIVGHDDLMERTLSAYLRGQGFGQVFASSALGLDVTNQRIVEDFFTQHRPDYVFLASTRSGGISANQKFPAEFLHHNLLSESHVIHMAYRCGVKKLLFLASSCVYPAQCRQPMKEEYLLTGTLESSNEPYSVAKIAGIKLCQAYRRQYGLNAVVMIPATLYGPGETADLEAGHVLGALIRKFYEAVKSGQKDVVVWGSGQPRREFLFADDFVSAVFFLMDQYNGGDIVNVGSGSDVAIKDLAQMIARISGFKGNIIYDRTKPDGVSRKLLDSSRVTALGWRPRVSLEEGIRRTWDAIGQPEALARPVMHGA